MYRERGNLMKKTALEVQIEASKKFSPYKLKDFLIRTEDGTIIVDRPKTTQNDKDNERLFLVVLNCRYSWGWRDCENVTIYFETDGEKVIGGVYNTRTKERETKRVIATESVGKLVYHYIYKRDTLNEIIGAIQNAPQRAKQSR